MRIQSFPALARATDDQTVKSGRQPDTELIAFDLQTARGQSNPSSINIPLIADETIVLYVKTLKLSKFANHPMGFINKTTWSPQDPPLIDLPRSSWDNNQLVPFINLTRTSSGFDSDTEAASAEKNLLRGWTSS
jgi:hypothetical protein